MLRGNKSLYTFLIKSVILYLLWSGLYHYWIKNYTALEETMTIKLAAISNYLMNAAGYDTYCINSYGNGLFLYSEIYLNEEILLLIGNPCNGLSLLVLFAGFIIAYPGNWLLKSLYILAGIVIIFIINISRVLILVLNAIYSQNTLDFNHKYTFTVAVYICVFGLWLYWVNNFSHKTVTLPHHAS